ncbi:hypothetical protein Bbelb_377260 [Branchiostoma belcheri]|nr:hypothetical protein Bbelb_377260 [Branchiostoma belcheri]
MGMFYAREQERGEPITVYALSLQELLKRAARGRGNSLADEDTMLRDRFLDGLRDMDLERQLRQYIRSANAANPRKFPEIRLEALHLSGEWGREKGKARQNATMVESALLAEMARLREETGKTMESLRKELHSLNLKFENQNSYRQGSPRVQPNGVRQGQAGSDNQGRPICYSCQEPGHIQSFKKNIAEAMMWTTGTVIFAKALQMVFDMAKAGNDIFDRSTVPESSGELPASTGHPGARRRDEKKSCKTMKLSEIKRHLKSYVQDELFRGEPPPPSHGVDSTQQTQT